MKELSEKSKSFLKDYKPCNRHYTTGKEIDSIVESLELKGMEPNELRETRDAVVIYYDALMDEELVLNGRIESFFGYMISMMSVTAVIDQYKLNSGVSVDEI